MAHVEEEVEVSPVEPESADPESASLDQEIQQELEKLNLVAHSDRDESS
jgi:hypothetical protein